jgi:NAD(P)H-dependent flavin oxidoreductase YrpB (nitropropane dioxygenase family)
MAISLNTRLTELLGCRYPIIQTAMGWVADPKLVAATGNAGGFGFLAGATIEPQQMEAAIIETRRLTDQPFGVNFHMYQANAGEIVELVLRHKVRAVSYSRSPGKQMISRLKDAGVVCIPTVGALKHAQKAVEMGADAVARAVGIPVPCRRRCCWIRWSMPCRCPWWRPAVSRMARAWSRPWPTAPKASPWARVS